MKSNELCPLCKTPFIKKNSWHRWCSRECGDIVRSRRYRRTEQYEQVRDNRRDSQSEVPHA